MSVAPPSHSNPDEAIERDIDRMRRAIDEAMAARGRVAPNPAVGAVVA